MSNKPDLGTLVGRPWNGKDTLDIYSHKAGGVLASIVDDKNLTMRMQAVSIFDHITEPRDADGYYIEELPCKSTPPQWGLLRKYENGNDALLGCVTTKQGAEQLLDYLKSNVREESNS